MLCELRETQFASIDIIELDLAKTVCNGSAHSSGCVVNGSNAMAAV